MVRSGDRIAMGIKKINTTTIREKVYNQLRSTILSGQIFPGESISLRQLAKDFGVSIMPVRESIWQLQSEGVVVVESNKNIRVNSLTVKEMEEVLDLRLVLETMAAEKACELRPDSAVQKVKSILEAVEGAVKNHRKYLKHNSDFHFKIYAYSNSQLLLDTIDRLWSRIGPYIFHAASSGDLKISMRHHKAMYDGFAKRDKKKIVNGIRGDLESAAEYIMPFIKHHS